MTGTQFKEWMDRNRMTQVEVASRMEWSQPFVSRTASRPDDLGEYLTARIEKLMDDVAREDLLRASAQLAGTQQQAEVAG